MELKCFETSAKDNINVDEVFEAIAKLIFSNKTDEQIKEEFCRQHSASYLSKDSQIVDTEKKKCC